MTEIREVSASRTIEVPAKDIFDLLANPSLHHKIDGSSTVQKGHPGNPDRLSLGSKFLMDMNLGWLPYKIANTVTAFDENKEIRWRHLGHHEWGYHLKQLDQSTTVVTETFDWANARLPSIFYQFAKYPEKNLAAITATLKRLDDALT